MLQILLTRYQNIVRYDGCYRSCFIFWTFHKVQLGDCWYWGYTWFYSVRPQQLYSTNFLAHYVVCVCVIWRAVILAVECIVKQTILKLSERIFGSRKTNLCSLVWLPFFWWWHDGNEHCHVIVIACCSQESSVEIQSESASLTVFSSHSLEIQSVSASVTTYFVFSNHCLGIQSVSASLTAYFVFRNHSLEILSVSASVTTYFVFRNHPLEILLVSASVTTYFIFRNHSWDTVGISKCNNLFYIQESLLRCFRYQQV
jgi:hypothetical protein